MIVCASKYPNVLGVPLVNSAGKAFKGQEVPVVDSLGVEDDSARRRQFLLILDAVDLLRLHAGVVTCSPSALYPYLHADSCAIGPDLIEKIDSITGDLKLY